MDIICWLVVVLKFSLWFLVGLAFFSFGADIFWESEFFDIGYIVGFIPWIVGAFLLITVIR